MPNLYPCIFANPIPTPLLGYLATQIPYNLICLFKNNEFSIETPLLYPGYIVGNDLGNAWEVPTLFGLEVGYPTKDSYILWAALWEASLDKRDICQP